MKIAVTKVKHSTGKHKRGAYIRSPGFVSDDTEQLLTAEQNIMKRWAEYFKTLLHVTISTENRAVEYQTAEPEIELPTVEEVQRQSSP